MLLEDIDAAFAKRDKTQEGYVELIALAIEKKL